MLPGLLGDAHGSVLAAADAQAHHGGLAGHAAPPELHHGVQEELADAGHAVRREQHAVVRARAEIVERPPDRHRNQVVVAVVAALDLDEQVPSGDGRNTT